MNNLFFNFVIKPFKPYVFMSNMDVLIFAIICYFSFLVDIRTETQSLSFYVLERVSDFALSGSSCIRHIGYWPAAWPKLGVVL